MITDLFVIILLMTAIIVGNVTMCICIFRTRKLHNPAGYIVASLATADLLVGVWLLPFSIPSAFARKWTLSSMVCDVNGYTNHVLCTSSMLNLLAVSIDRYIAIFYPLRYREYMTTRRSVLFIVGAWIYGFLTATFPLLGWARYVFAPGIWLCVTDFKVSYSFSYFIIVTVFVIPLCVMAVVYYKIFHVAYKHMACIRQQEITNSGGDNNSHLSPRIIPNAWSKDDTTCKSDTKEKLEKYASASNENKDEIPQDKSYDIQYMKLSRERKEEKKKKITMKRELRTGIVLFVIVMIFVISWSPFAVLNLYALHTNVQPSSMAEAIVSRLAYLNSAVNPPLYCLMNKTIRNAVKKLWLGLFSICGVNRLFKFNINLSVEDSQERTMRSVRQKP